MEGSALNEAAAALLPPALRPILAKVLAGERLSRADGLTLTQCERIYAVGYLANLARRQRAGDRVFFNNNAHINYSNVCAIYCKFCAFAKSPNHPDGYTMSIDDIVRRAVSYARHGVTEFHMVGGLHPELPFAWYLDMLRAVKARLPHVHMKCFTAVEVDWFARLSGLGIEEVLGRLKEAGLSSMTGGGAEILAQRVRDQICRPKISGERWLQIHRAAHLLGIPSTATMLYGTVETAAEIVDHMLALRALQDETGGFKAFIPLAFHPKNTGLEYMPAPTGFQDLRVVAAGRLLLDNIPHIKSYWVMLSPQMAQISLRFGANDVDGTVREEKIYHDAGAQTPMLQTADDLVALIKEVGLVPTERDTVYAIVREHAEP